MIALYAFLAMIIVAMALVRFCASDTHAEPPSRLDELDGANHARYCWRD